MRKRYSAISLLSTQAEARLRYEREVKTIGPKGFGFEESCGKHQKPYLGKIGA